MYVLLPLIGLVVIIYVLWPIYSRSRHRSIPSEAHGKLNDLRMRRDEIFRNIVDLDFEKEMGKLVEKDYASLRESYKEEVANVYERLEAAGELKVSKQSAQEKREAPDVATAAPPTEKVFCTQCGASNPADSRFCARCGAGIVIVVEDEQQ